MKSKTLMMLAVSVFMFAGALTAEDKKPGITGKWATDAATAAIKQKKQILLPGECPPNASCAGSLHRGIGNPPNVRGGFGNRFLFQTINNSSPVQVQASGNNAMTMELKIDKTRLVGKVTDVWTGTTTRIEDAKIIDAKRFEFVVYQKVNRNKVGTTFRGELVAENTILIDRVMASRAHDSLVFHRAK